jgi:hypothetical protein
MAQPAASAAARSITTPSFSFTWACIAVACGNGAYTFSRTWAVELVAPRLRR